MAGENDISLLWRLDADASGVDRGTKNAAAAVARLRSQFGHDAAQFEAAGVRAIQQVSGQLTEFVNRRLPLLGKGFSTISQGLGSLGPGATASLEKLKGLETSIGGIAKESGKTKEQITGFLTSFAAIEGTTNRNKLALDFFGQSTQSLSPKLEKAAAELKSLSAEASTAATSFQGIITPSSLALISVTALAVAAVAAITTLAHLGKEATEYGDSIHQAHLKTRIGIENLGALRIAAHGVGQDLGSLSIAFLRLQKNIEAADKGNEKLVRTLQKEGITSFKNADAALVEFFDHFSGLSTEEEKIASASAVFGQRFGARLIGTFDQVRGSLTEFKDELRASGQLLSEDQVRAAAAADDANDKLREAYDALGRQIGISVVPIMAKVTDLLADNIKTAIALAGALGLVGAAILAIRFPAAIAFITSLGSSAKILGQAMAAAIVPTLEFAAAEQVAAVSTAALAAAFGGILIVAIGAAIIIWSQYESATDSANAITAEMTEELKRNSEAAIKLSDDLNELKQAQAGSNEQHQKLNDILKQLDPQTRAYIESVEDMEERIRRATAAVSDNIEVQRTFAKAQALTLLTGLIEQYTAEEKALQRLTAAQKVLRVDQSQTIFDQTEAAKAYAKTKQEIDTLRVSIEKNEKNLRAAATAAGLSFNSFEALARETTDNDAAIKRLNESYVRFTPTLDTSAEKLKEQAEAWERLRKALRGELDSQTLLNELAKAGVDLTGEQAEANEKYIDQYKTGLDITQRTARENAAKAEADFKQGLINNQEYARQRIANEVIVSVAEEEALKHRLDLKNQELQELAKKAQVKPEKSEQEALAKGIQEAKDLNQQLLDLRSNRAIKARQIEQEADEAEKKLRQDRKAVVLELEEATNRAILEKKKELAKAGGFQLDITEGTDAVSPTFVKKATESLKRALNRVLGDPEIQRAVKEAARTSGLPEALLDAIIAVESGGERLARSPVGATGLMQIMEANFKGLGIAGRKEAENATVNIRAGAKLFADELRKANGDIRQALVAWNSTIKGFVPDRDAGRLPQVIQEFITKVQIANNLIPKSSREAAAEEARVNVEALEAQRKSYQERLASLGKYAAERVDLEKQVSLLTIKINQARLAEDRRVTEEEKAENKRRIEAVIASFQTSLRVSQIADQQRIAGVKAAADLRIKTEEGAEREILAVRLAASEEEARLLRARQLVAKRTIEDPEERRRVLNDLNNQLRINSAERDAIEAEGSRKVEDGRAKDLKNLEEYLNQRKQISEQVLDLEVELQNAALAFLQAHHAKRSTIIRAQNQLEIDAERRRFQTALDGIRKEQEAAAQRVKAIDKVIAKLREEGKAETEEALTAIRARAAANGVLTDLDRKAEKELELHLQRMKNIRGKGEADEKGAKKREGGLSALGIDKEEIQNDIQALEESIIPLNDILVNSFHQVADAIGQTVSNWVLLGETGPAVMRKILAQALASVAAEAAVNAIKELALGFATLFFNPAESAAHFTSAALWGSIAGVAAIAGRSVAGDLFKSKAGNSSGGSGSNGSGGSGSNQALQTIVQGRNQVQVVRHEYVLRVEADEGKFGQALDTHFESNFRDGGKYRELVLNDGGV